MIRYSCPKCDTHLKSADDTGGTKTACPRCGERFLVPTSSEEGSVSERKERGSRDGKTAVMRKKSGPKTASKGAEKEKSRTLLYVGIGAGVLAIVAVVGVIVTMNSNDGKPTTGDNTSAQTSAPPFSTATVGPATGIGAAPTIQGSNAGVPQTTASPTAAPQTPVATPVVAASTTEKAVETSVARAPEVGTGNRVYKRLLQSTTWVVTKLNDGGMVTGSGSLVDRKNKLVLTNFHVVSHHQQGQMFVFFPTYEKGDLVSERNPYIVQMIKGEGGIPCSPVVKDDKHDIALLRLGGDIPAGIQQLRLSRSSATPGETVHSLGNPGGSGALWVYTSGTVRQVYQKHWLAGGLGDILQLEARVVETQSPTNPGDSGGPLVNDRSELVAVTQGGSAVANSISIFIDVSEVKNLLAGYYQSNNLKPDLDVPVNENRPTDVTSLVKALENNNDIQGRVDAASTLGRMGPDAKAALSHLVKGLKDKDDNVRKSAAEAIEQIGQLTTSQIQAVTEALKDPSADVRIAAASALGSMGSEAEDAVKPLIETMKDPESSVRKKAINALAKIGSTAKEAVPALGLALADRSSEVRSEAATALSKIGVEAKAAVPALGKALSDSNNDVKLHVLAALESIGPDANEIIPLLKKPLKERNKEVRQRACAVVAAIGPDAKGVAPEVAALLDEEELQAPAEEALKKIGKDAVPALIEMLKHRNPDARKGAAETLGKIGPEAKKSLAYVKLLAIRDPFEKVRRASAIAYDKIQGK